MSAASNTSQLNDLRSYSRHWLGEFIDLYQAEQCLWQPKHPDYSNHGERNKAYDKLVEKLKEVEPNPDRAMVVRKINSLRSAFRREYRKTTSKCNYETRLWYYEKLLFIADQNTKRMSNGTIDSKPPKRSLGLTFDEDDSMDFENDEQQMESSNAQPEHTQSERVSNVRSITNECLALVKTEDQQQHTQQTQPATQTDQPHEQLHATHLHQQQQQHTQQHTQQSTQHTTEVKVLEITSLDSNSQREIQQAVNSLEHQHHMQQQLQQHHSGQTTTTAQLAQIHQQVPTIQIAREHLQPLFGNSTYSTATSHRQDDEYDAIGINVASKLRVMNPTQRIIAEKLISDVLFNGQLDNLSINSALSQ